MVKPSHLWSRIPVWEINYTGPVHVLARKMNNYTLKTGVGNLLLPWAAACNPACDAGPCSSPVISTCCKRDVQKETGTGDTASTAERKTLNAVGCWGYLFCCCGRSMLQIPQAAVGQIQQGHWRVGHPMHLQPPLTKAPILPFIICARF